MELLHLKYFQCVAKHLNYTKAAEELKISQPALSMMVKKLEQELKIDLFYKKGRNIFLTDNGEILLKSADHIMNELNKAEELIYKNEETKQNTITFASSHSRLISALFDKYIEGNPQYMFNCEIEKTGKITQKLLNYDIQFALSSMKISHPDINSRLIINEDIVITYPKYYDDKNPDFIYNNDIYKTFIFPSHNYDYNNFIKNNLKYMNIKIHNINYVDDAFIDSIAKQRQYFSFIPVSMCKELGIPYIKDSNLIIRTFIYLSSAKNNILSEANLNMYQFIEKYLMNRQAFYVV
ncbi:LysR family transcriptional regulator [Staphylococcus succinus]|uniref:LysR family transcriptional regulator n=1 Tax=Staphylococcus succinus TaxID=61015 RepID=UPI001C0453C1|nr:LysR family transcriptional regulator [Staphylococcus succinus]MBU0439346.1 LysR family transcriptional regulator [Staphylococcus succinus]